MSEYENSGKAINDHFVETNKMVILRNEAEIKNISLTRYACYLKSWLISPRDKARGFDLDPIT